jgi:general secretion pathway protein D
MRKPVLKLHRQAMIAGLACAAVYPSVSVAGTGSSSGGGSSIVELEIIKRQQRVAEALAAEAEGDQMMADQDYEGAVGKYRTALQLIPLGSINSADRNRVIAKFSRAAVNHARDLGHRGGVDKAKSLLNEVLAENVDPNNAEAKKLMKDLDDPDIFNPAMDEKHYADTEEVRRLLRMGLGYYDLGNFKKAEDQFNRVLAIDPYNTAARRQLEKTEREKSNYYRSARDHTRIKMLNEVDAMWVTPVPGGANVPKVVGDIGQDDANSAPMTFKLNNITIDRIQFNDASIDEVIGYLKRKSIESDSTSADPNQRGVDFIVKSAEGAKNVTLELRSVKLLDAIKSITEVANMRYDITPNAVIIVPATSGGGSMTTRTFRAPPDFLSRGAGGGGDSADAAAPADPFSGGGAEADTGPKLKGKPNAKEVLASLGVQFAEGTMASFDPSTGRLIVRNTFEQLDLVETVVDGMNTSGSVKQVYITTKFVEVSQRNTDELGFDWLMGAFNIGGGGVYGAGGTSGNASALSSGNYTFINPGGGTSSVPTGTNPLTRGLRFGSDAITRGAIDSLLGGGSATAAGSVSPATFALAGVFTDPQFQVMMRALSQKKGVDLMTAPSVIVRGGQRSKIEIIREFPYPTEYDPPQIPQNFGGGLQVGGGGGVGGGGAGGGSFPVTPANPNSFQFRNTGVSMEVEATVGDDGYTIDLNLAPEVTEFEGFINYGSPIQTTSTNALGQSIPVVLTENKILQPVFATRKLSTQVLIWDRQTVGIGGLMREDVQSVEDKVPIFSSIPLVGRLFKTKAEERYKKNLMIYVTGRLIDPSGQDLHGSTEPEPEIVPAEPGPSTDLLPIIQK